MIFELKVKTCAKENKIVSKNNQFQAHICAQPEKGKANKVLIELISQHFKVKKQSISIVSGLKSKYKLIRINDNLKMPLLNNIKISNQHFSDKKQKYLSKFHSWDR